MILKIKISILKNCEKQKIKQDWKDFQLNELCKEQTKTYESAKCHEA